MNAAVPRGLNPLSPHSLKIVTSPWKQFIGDNTDRGSSPPTPATEELGQRDGRLTIRVNRKGEPPRLAESYIKAGPGGTLHTSILVAPGAGRVHSVPSRQSGLPGTGDTTRTGVRHLHGKEWG